MITRQGRVKVLDFGLAKRSAAPAAATTELETSVTAPGVMIGTVAYMAPEQLRGQPADLRSDVWALGVVLYELLSGRRPFRGETAFEVSSAILGATPQPLPASLPAGIRNIVDRCLAKDPGQRPLDARTLCAELAGTVDKTAVNLQDSVLDGVRKVPRAVMTIAGAVLALSLLWGLLPANMHRLVPGFGARIDSVPVLPLDNLSGDPSKTHLADGVQETLIGELAKLPQLKRVIERRSTARFRGSDKRRGACLPCRCSLGILTRHSSGRTTNRTTPFCRGCG